MSLRKKKVARGWRRILGVLVPLVLAACGGGSGGPSGGTTQLPVTPTGIKTTPGNAEVSLSWSAVAGATSYGVQRSGASGGPFSTIGSPTGTSYVDTGLVNGTTYYYEIVAVNGAGSSPVSGVYSATPEPALPAPSVPTGVAAAPGNADVLLTWTASMNAASYTVARANTSAGPYTTVGTTSAPSYTDTGLTNGTTYYYVVAAVDATGTSGNSPAVSATPEPAVQIPAVPSGLMATGGNAAVTLTWSSSGGATGYVVSRSTTSGGPFTQIATPTSSTYVDGDLTNGTAYYYVVAAVDSAGSSANSAQVTATPVLPLQIPATPLGLTATAGTAQVTLAWQPSVGATSYHVKRATVSGGPYTQIGAPASSPYTDATAANGTAYFYVVSALDAAGESPDSAQAAATPLAADVTITIAPGTTRAISPYIYGINSYVGSGSPSGITADRWGGNRSTAYNWETNASNAGSDYLYENDAFFPGSVPATTLETVIADDHAAQIASIVTFQLQGLVAADENASQTMDMTNPPISDANRFDTVIYKKSTQSSVPFTTSPDLTDGYVYMDELIWNLDHFFGGQGIFDAQPTTQPTFAQLDNEPDLWNATHKEIQGPTEITPAAFITKSIDLAQSLKAQFPHVVVFGPVNYGFEGIYSWQGALTGATPTGSDWFADQYMTAMHAAAVSYGQPVVDVYDFHWYSQVDDGNGGMITGLNTATLSAAQIQSIVQSPRSLWDTTYTENSWIIQVLNTPIYILGRLQAKIAAENPGMKLSITEYNNGGAQHIAGTIAEADDLGIFGAQGLYAANLWPLTTSPYLLGGFRAFRNFDGGGANFGDTSVQTVSSNVANVAGYASTDSTRPGRVVFVVINRSTASQTTALVGMPLSGTAHKYQMTAASAAAQAVIAPVSAGTQPVSGTSMTVTTPSLSVTTIDVY